MASVRLFCFAHAGGGASWFRSWGNFVPEFCEVVGVQLPGRETLFSSEPITTLHSLLPKLVETIVEAADRPFAFFGHSMGALLAYRLIVELHRAGYDLPRHLIVSSCAAPHVYHPSLLSNVLSDAELISTLEQMGGVTRDIVENREIWDIFLPALRADIRVLEESKGFVGPPVNCDITALLGDRDSVTVREVDEWRACTQTGFEIHAFSGGHFYLYKNPEPVLNEVSKIINRIKDRK